MAVWAAVFVTGCREGVPPFEVMELAAESEGSRRLTWNPSGDRKPVWSVDGDSIYYSVVHHLDYSVNGRTMLRISRTGGSPSLVAPEAQFRIVVPLLSPSPSPDGEWLAYVQLYCLDAGCTQLAPEANVRVRRTVNGGNTIFDAAIGIMLTGSVVAEVGFGPTWSPDSRQLIFSDGSRLQKWTIGESAAEVMAGTEGALHPSWSADGKRIAYARNGFIEVLDVSTGAMTSLSVGSEPSWSGATVYFSGPEGIYRKSSGGNGVAMPVPNTAGGRSPAVSPDGRWLAFTRVSSGRTAPNLWVLDLGSGP